MTRRPLKLSPETEVMSSEAYRIQAMVDGLDQIAVAMERKWGVGRLRLLGFHELSARVLWIGATGRTNGPQLAIGEADLQLDPIALRQLKLRLNSIGLRRGRVLWPVASTNDAPSFLEILDVATTLRFHEGDRWELDHFDSRFLGARLHLTASLTNASAFRSLSRSLEPATPGRTPVPRSKRRCEAPVPQSRARLRARSGRRGFVGG